jgi:uncharacterized membrane protein
VHHRLGLVSKFMKPVSRARPAILIFTTIAGVLVTIAGLFLQADGKPFGWLVVIGGLIMSYLAKRAIHHTVTQPLGLVLIIFGFLVQVAYAAMGGEMQSIFNIALGLMLSGFALAAGKAGGWQGN